MQKFNYHTHTARCGHAVGTDEEYVQAALKCGYTALGFSEHIQFRAYNGQYGRIDYEAFPKYFRDIYALRDRYKNQISIFCGIEAEFIPEYLLDLYDLRRHCDFFILGQHRGGPNSYFYENSCTDEDVLHYATDIEYAIRTGLFCIIAHPDYFMRTRNTWSDACIEASWKICQAARESGCPLELNLKGTRGSQLVIDGHTQFPYPFRPFWEIVARSQAPVIWGIDAHNPADFLHIGQFRRAKEIIAELDLNFMSSFRPYMQNID